MWRAACAAGVVAACLAGCGSGSAAPSVGGGTSAPSPSSVSAGTDTAAPSAGGGTSAPSPTSESGETDAVTDVAEPGGRWYVVIPGAARDGANDEPGQPFLTDVVEVLSEVARERGAEVDVITADEAGGIGAAVAVAVEAAPDLIVGVSSAALTELSFTAAEHLDQQFLLIDAIPAEPTANLTALLFDAAQCPAGATCATRDDVYDQQVLFEAKVPDLPAAVAAAVDQVAQHPGSILLATLESALLAE